MLSLDHIPPSDQLFTDLAQAGEPVILNFSRGKDSVCTWIKLAEYGIPVIPVHKSVVPGMKWVRDDLDRYEQHFGTHIVDIPTYGFYKQLKYFLYMPPQRCAVIEAIDIPDWESADYDQLVRNEYAKEDTWILDGVRATDSATRRMAIAQHGAVKPRSRRQSPIWDFTRAKVMKTIHDAGLHLGPDYEMAGRSFDSLRGIWIKKIKERFPDDYEVIKFWFPLADMALMRMEELGVESF